MENIKTVNVFYNGMLVGKLAKYMNRLAAFQYSDEWMEKGFSVSPFSLPLDDKVYIPDVDPFEGMYGVFSDSLPDGWGRLIVDRLMRKNGIDPIAVGNIDRLSIVGQSGLGALTYEPEINLEEKTQVMSLDTIAEECAKILKTDYSDNLDELVRLGGSSGGARPKIMTDIDGEDWIIKFAYSGDYDSMGKMEYDYAVCAKECGIEMSEVRLFNSKICDGYFGTKRFDRQQIEGKTIRKHMVSVSGLLETSHRIPNLDYNLLMKLTIMLTKDMEECKKLYRLMCFNVFAHNRDDHSKNFSFIYNDDDGRWMLSPAYDLTYSNSIGGEHATTVNGNGKNPEMKDILAVAKKIGINSHDAKIIAEDIQENINVKLGKYIIR